jgi:hypothetical protein
VIEHVDTAALHADEPQSRPRNRPGARLLPDRSGRGARRGDACGNMNAGLAVRLRARPQFSQLHERVIATQYGHPGPSAATSAIRPARGLGRDWAGRAIGLLWSVQRNRPSTRDFFAQAIEAKSGPAPTAPVCAAMTEELRSCRAFALDPELATTVKPASKTPKHQLSAHKNPAFAGLSSGRPDLNRGPHRPE